MKTYRVVCTKNPNCTIVDFASADNAENATITHENLLKLRQYQTPESEALLPPLILKDDDKTISVNFDKPEKASVEEQTILKETTPRILSSYNRFKQLGQNSTLQITEETLAVAYNFINPYNMAVNSPADERFKKDLERSQRMLRTYHSKHKSFRGD